MGPDGELNESDPSETRQVVSEQTASQMQSIMREVVCSGTADSARVDGWSIAGKTRTAYKAQADGTYFNADGVTHDYYPASSGSFPPKTPRSPC